MREQQESTVRDVSEIVLHVQIVLTTTESFTHIPHHHAAIANPHITHIRPSRSNMLPSRMRKWYRIFL
jgi:hypothetical protein